VPSASGGPRSECPPASPPPFTGTSRAVKQGRRIDLLSGRAACHVMGDRAAIERGTDCTSTVGLVASAYCRADPDTNRSAGLHSFLVMPVAIGVTKEESSLPAAGLTCLLHLRTHVWQAKQQKIFRRFASRRCDDHGWLRTHVARIERSPTHEHGPQDARVLVGQGHHGLLPS
jgi:hypothetical protein